MTKYLNVCKDQKKNCQCSGILEYNEKEQDEF